VRLYSTKSFKALGTLVYHKDALQAIAFAHASPVAAPNTHQHFSTTSSGGGGEEDSAPGTGVLAGSRTSGRPSDGDDGEGDVVDDGDDGGGSEEEDDEMNGEEKARRSRWLVSGGKDGRVVVWGLIDFTARADNNRRSED
jgi:ASTRA-associated protein 1